MSSWMAIVNNELGWKGLQFFVWRQAPSWNSRTITSQSMRDGELFIDHISSSSLFNMTLSRGCSGTQGALLLVSMTRYNINIASVHITLSRGCSGTQGDTQLEKPTPCVYNFLPAATSLTASCPEAALEHKMMHITSQLLLVSMTSYNINIASVHMTLSRGCSGTQGDTQLEKPTPLCIQLLTCSY